MANLGKEKTIEQIKAELASLSPEERAKRLKKAREMLEEKKQIVLNNKKVKNKMQNLTKTKTTKKILAEDLPNRIRPLTAQEKKELIEHPEGKLKNDFDVAVKIYEITVINGGDATFSGIVEEFDKLGVEKNEVSKNLDKLFDLCIVDGHWTKDEKTKTWKRTFTISDESLPLIESIYNKKVQTSKQNITKQEKQL